MPTFLNQILRVFTANAGSEIGDSGIDFAELSASDLTGYSIRDNILAENKFVFVATNNVQGPLNGQFSVILSDGTTPISQAKLFKVFTSKEEQTAVAVSVTLYEQLEPFIEIISSNQKSRPFFSNSSTVKDFCTTGLLHPDYNSSHLMAAIPTIKFVDPKTLYPKAAIHHKMNSQSQTTGITPLMVALEAKNLNFISEAVSSNGQLRDVVDFSLSDFNQRNYVYYAVKFHIEAFPTTDPEKDKDGFMAKIAMSYPDGARLVDSEGRSPLHLAVAAKRIDVLKFLVRGSIGNSALEHNPKSVASLLHVAAEAGHLEIMQYLLEHAPELVLLKDSKYNATPLHWATTLEAVDALLDAGCDPDQLSNTGETAIHVALRYDRIPVVSALIAFAAKLDVVAPEIGAAIHMVSNFQKPNKQIAEMLIAYGCDIDVKDNRNHTARHLAAVGARPPPEEDMSSAPTTARITNVFYSMLGRDDDDKRRRDECENILALLHYVGAKRCPPGTLGCAPGCSHDGNVIGSLPQGYPSTFPIVDIGETPALLMIDQLLAEKVAAEYAANPEKYKKKIRMLCLDGGGIRGLMTTLTLRHLEKMIGFPIIECFDYIGGTSVGGLIALSLTYGKPYGPSFAPCCYDPLVNMQRLAYQMRRKVFIGSRPYSTTKFEELLKKAFGVETALSEKSTPMVMVTSVLANRFPAELFMFRNYSSAVDLYEQAHPSIRQDQVTKEVDAKAGLTVSPSSSMAQLNSQNEQSSRDRAPSLLSSPARSTSPPPTISVTSGSSSVFNVGSPANGTSSPMSPSASQQQINSPEEKILVWRAARSTGAAPTYFRAAGNYIDGGVMANNPTLDAMTDVYQLSAVTKALGFGEDVADRYQIGVVLSIGTGREVQRETPVADLRRPEGITDMTGLYKSVMAFINLLVDQATVADGRPVDRSRAWCAQMGAMYHRLSPVFSHHVELDEHDEPLLIRALYETRAYLHSKKTELEQLTSVLREITIARKRDDPNTSLYEVMEISNNQSMDMSFQPHDNVAMPVGKEETEKDFNKKLMEALSVD